MPCCSAPNCHNRNESGFRLFKFPKDNERRQKWLINCRRDKWKPTENSTLCEMHFEPNQFETRRSDGWKRLKLTAIPTIFNVPNPPPSLTIKRPNRKRSPSSSDEVKNKRIATHVQNDHHYSKENNIPPNTCEMPLDSEAGAEQTNKPDFTILQSRITTLQNKVWIQQKQITRLEECLSNTAKSLSNFLSEEQIRMLQKTPSQREEWSQEAIVYGLKMKFSLGIKGYNYLRNTGYPLPSTSTLNRRLQALNFDYGLIRCLLPFLKEKVNVFSDKEKDCVVLLDEMFISPAVEYDSSNKTFTGKVTLGISEVKGNHLLVCLLRGITTPWKQIIRYDITGPSTSGAEMKEFLMSVLESISNIGLHVRALVSDMGASNKALWNILGIEVTRGNRITSFKNTDGGEVHVFADPPHLLKNLRNALLKDVIELPQDIVEDEGLPSNIVNFDYVKTLWKKEQQRESGLRFLHHLTCNHLFPNHFQKMKVSLAVHVFSVGTASGLESAVAGKLIEKEALTLAWFIRIISTWFEMMTARCRKKSLTAKNLEKKEKFLRDFIYIVEHLKIGNCWKPIQTGLILSTLSMLHLANECIRIHGYGYLLTGRINQDALENIFSVLRSKIGKSPTPLQCKKGIKLISVSQFLATTGGNYTPDKDTHLFDFSYMKEVPKELSTSTYFSAEVRELESPNIASRSSSSNSSKLPDVALSSAERNCLYFLAGSCVKSVIKSLKCSICIGKIKSTEEEMSSLLPDDVLWTSFQNYGGLTFATLPVYDIIKIANDIYMSLKKKNFGL